MKQALVDSIVRAVLYEGYILYPYRPSSVKNRQRWTFGGIYPRAYSETQGGSDAWMMQAQCLLTFAGATTVGVAVRFLHLVERTVWRIDPASGSAGAMFQRVPSFEAGGRIFQDWQEAVERTIDLGKMPLAELTSGPRRHDFVIPAASRIELLRDAGRTVGRLVREQQQIRGAIELSAEAKSAGVYQLTVRVLNESSLDDAADTGRGSALMRSLASTHMILGVHGGEFASSTDPPQPLQQWSDACQNVGCWPVLVGEAGQTDTLLVSPIILYDYPQVAPESPGDLFDGCEIDEILTLRILTLTDDEKRQAAAADPLAAQMLARTESLAREQLMGLHGVMRGTRPATEERHA